MNYHIEKECEIELCLLRAQVLACKFAGSICDRYDAAVNDDDYGYCYFIDEELLQYNDF